MVRAVLFHELRRGKLALLIWSISVAALLAGCALLYPSFQADAEELGKLFASMGGFSAAFGMDRLDIGTFAGFYAVECGTVAALGGGLYGALIGISALSGEEAGRTAEFLFSHPVSRTGVLAAKLGAVLLQVLLCNGLLLAAGAGSAAAVGVDVPWRELLLLHLGYLLLHGVLAMMCFGLSAFLRRSAAGVGLGLATVLYFLSLAANLTEAAEPLSYLTPYAFCDGAYIFTEGSLKAGPLAVSLLISGVCLIAGFVWYQRKDIQ